MVFVTFIKSLMLRDHWGQAKMLGEIELWDIHVFVISIVISVIFAFLRFSISRIYIYIIGKYVKITEIDVLIKTTNIINIHIVYH